MVNIMIIKKELIITYSSEKKQEVEKILKDNELEYKIKTLNRLTSSALGTARSRIGMVGLKEQIEYKFYVKPCDYDLAKHLIAGQSI